MKFVVPFQREATLPNALVIKAIAGSSVDFFRQRPNLVWTFIALATITTYALNNRKPNVINYIPLSAYQRPVVLDIEQKPIEEQLSDLETFYLEEILHTSTPRKSVEVLTAPNIYLDESFYHFDKVDKTFYRRSNRYIKKVKKGVMEEKLLASLPQLFHKNAKNYIKAILHISQKYSIDPFWLTSVMWTESHFKHRAKSGVGASGLMQIMPGTKKYILRKARLQGVRLEAMKGWDHLASYNPTIKTWMDYKRFKSIVLNIELGAYYLKYLLKTFNSHMYATVAYNMGPGWINNRIRRKRPVGTKNRYLDKVRKAYKYILKRFPKA